LVEDATKARWVFEAGHFEVGKEIEVLVMPGKGHHGALGTIFLWSANTMVSIQPVYLATTKSLVVFIDDLAKAQAAVDSKKPV